MWGTVIVIIVVGVVLIILIVVCRRRRPRCQSQDEFCPRDEGPRASELDEISGGAPPCNPSRDLMSFANQIAGGWVGCLHEHGKWSRAVQCGQLHHIDCIT